MYENGGVPAEGSSALIVSGWSTSIYCADRMGVFVETAGADTVMEGDEEDTATS